MTQELCNELVRNHNCKVAVICNGKVQSTPSTSKGPTKFYTCDIKIRCDAEKLVEKIQNDLGPIDYIIEQCLIDNSGNKDCFVEEVGQQISSFLNVIESVLYISIKLTRHNIFECLIKVKRFKHV